MRLIIQLPLWYLPLSKLLLSRRPRRDPIQGFPQVQRQDKTSLREPLGVVVGVAPMEASPFSYHKFVNFALEEAQHHTTLAPLPRLGKFRCMKSIDEKSMLHMVSHEAPKIRLLRSLAIDGGHSMQVLDFAVFPKLEFDLPIFCANFFTTPRLSIMLLDLNPLHDVISQKDYKEKYYKKLLPLGQRYAKLLPWGEKLTSESIRFFSPIVIWTKFESSTHMHDVLYAAFVDYFKEWLRLMDIAVKEKDEKRVLQNREAQHRYLMWRAQKDPGRPILQKLVGESLAEDVVKNFLFDGVNYLRDGTFLDYFPEYRCEDGSISEKRSIAGKSFETRPWDENGNFIGR